MTENQLKFYYSTYLKQVRKVKESTVNHYFQAVSRISDYLNRIGFISFDLFQINSLEILEDIKLFLTVESKPGRFDFVPKELRELDMRGNRMYINGFMHYYNFLNGYDFANDDEILLLDHPFAVPNKMSIYSNSLVRNPIFRKQVIESANYMCEIDASHTTFIQKSTNYPYMEAHHLIPLKVQDLFDFSLDIYANIICLCPNCHRFLHYGRDNDREIILKDLFNQRAERFWKSGLKIDCIQFVEFSMLIKTQ